MLDLSKKPSAGLTVWAVLLGLVILASGLFRAVFGAQLLLEGGSWYFAISGLIEILAGVQLMRRRQSAVVIYGVMFFYTLIWSYLDAGLEFWPQLSRIMVPSGFMMLLLFTWPALRRTNGRLPVFAAPSFSAAVVILAGMLVMLWQAFVPHPTVKGDENANIAPIVPQAPDAQNDNWEHWGNTAGGDRFAPFTQINRDNVKDLKVAWTFHTGDTPLSPTGGGAEDQQTPLQIGDTLYLCTPNNNVIAVNADTGKEIWKHEMNSKAKVWVRCRGLAYFDAEAPLQQPTDPDATPVPPVTLAEGDSCKRRLFMNTVDGRLIALNADNGEFCTQFGNNGTVNLLENLGVVEEARYSLTSAPTLAGTTIMVGGRVADNVATDMPGGVLRGYDVITGKLRWAFDLRNPDPNHELAAGEIYIRSSANNWAPSSYDAASNTLFVPMGSPSVDVWGGNRVPEDHKYGASVLALDGTTGHEKWVYQTVHNDLWDFDVPMQPSLIDFPVDGKDVPAVMFGTKAGQIFVLDRKTGKPLTKVIEQEVPVGNVPREQYSHTQPRSVEMPQIGAETLTESDMWGATPYDQLLCRVNFKKMRYNGLYTAPGTDVSLSYPGSLGGMNWGSMAFDPNNQLAFVNDMRLGLWIKLIPAQNNDGSKASDGAETPNTVMGAVPMVGAPYSVDKNRFMSALKIPCQKPPFGTMSAIDLKTRKLAWQVPVGTVEDTGPLGIKMHLKMPVGMPTIGGPLSTQGGLVFFAASQDYYLRAFDSATGKELWKARLPVGSQGTPMSYISPKTGKQYIVISAGGARQSPDRGDYVIAYALP